MLFLPLSDGLQVGATTFAAPVRQALTIGSAKLRGSDSPALKLEEIVFTAFYPAQVTRNQRKGLDWLIR